MSQELVLTGSGFQLVLSMGKDTWTTVFLKRADSTQLRFGAEALEIILAKMLDFLIIRKTFECKCTYQTTSCHAVLTLAEPHAIVFAHRQNSLVRFFVVGFAGEQIGEFTLDEKLAETWENKLRLYQIQTGSGSRS